MAVDTSKDQAPVIEPGYNYGSITEKISSLVLTQKTPLGWYAGLAVSFLLTNVLLLSIFDHLNQVRRAVAWNSVVRYSDRPARDHSSFAEHNQIVAAIEARDAPAAHAAMRQHLGSVSARLFGDY